MDTTVRLLDVVVAHAHANDAHKATCYQRILLANAEVAVGTEDDLVSPMFTVGVGELAKLVLVGYSLVHKHYRVTPSMEADFFVPVYESKLYLQGNNKLY